MFEDLRAKREAPSSTGLDTSQDIISHESEKAQHDAAQETRVVAHEMWEEAIISWRPNDQTVVATLGNRKAEGREKELIPEFLAEKVLGKKKKTATARVRVEPVGRDAYRIIKIED